MLNMIEKILPPEKCVECKGCCFFGEDDVWEAPESLLPAVNGIMNCRRLTERGCALGKEKPLECALYPFRIMRLGEHKVIAVSNYCKAVSDLPLNVIVEFVNGKASEFLALSDSNPQIVKEYNKEYTIIYVC